MKKFIDFCNKTSGSHWWLIMTIISITLPILAIIYTFYQFTGIHPALMEKMIIGCDYSLLSFIRPDHGLICENPFPESIVPKSMLFAIDMALLYTVTFSETFFRLCKRNIFMVADPSVELCGWNAHIMKFNSEKEARFFRLCLGMKGYWLQPFGNSNQYEPVQRSYNRHWRH